MRAGAVSSVLLHLSTFIEVVVVQAFPWKWEINSLTGNVAEDPGSDHLVRITTKTGSGDYDAIDGVDSYWQVQVEIAS